MNEWNGNVQRRFWDSHSFLASSGEQEWVSGKAKGLLQARLVDKSLAGPPTHKCLSELSEIHQEGWTPKRRCSLVFQVWILYSIRNIYVTEFSFFHLGRFFWPVRVDGRPWGWYNLPGLCPCWHQAVPWPWGVRLETVLGCEALLMRKQK